MKNSGFTLLETIIYLALFSVLMSGAVMAVYQLLSSIDKDERTLKVLTESNFINQKLDWALSGKSVIEIIDTNTLKITRLDDPLISPLTFNFYDAQLYLSRNGGVPLLLTNNTLKISDVTVSYLNGHLQYNYKVNGDQFWFVAYVE